MDGLMSYAVPVFYMKERWELALDVCSLCALISLFIHHHPHSSWRSTAPWSSRNGSSPPPPLRRRHQGEKRRVGAPERRCGERPLEGREGSRACRCCCSVSRW